MRTVRICMGSSCFARGNEENLKIIESYISKNNLDVKIELIGTRCESQCASGPNIIIDNKIYSGVNTDNIGKILEELKK